MDVLGYFASFLGGGFLTAMLFVVGYTNRIATMSNKIENLTTALNAHIAMPQTPCVFHQQLSETVAVLKNLRDGAKQ